MANHRHDAGREKRPAGVIPRKRFGQHFLADRACIDAIVQARDVVSRQPQRALA